MIDEIYFYEALNIVCKDKIVCIVNTILRFNLRYEYKCKYMCKK